MSELPATMTKVVIPSAGSYDKLTIQDLPLAPPGANEVTIETRAIGINYADCIVRMGLYKSAKEFVGWPITPGFEVSGIIVATGAEVTDFKVGDEVAAVTLFNGYSTHVSVSTNYVFKKPEMLSFEQAAAMPAVFMTAWFALFELAHPRAGSNILIHSAAGGVGSSLVQLAKIAGCKVAGVVGRSHKVETARDLGADLVIDKSSEDLWQKAEQFCPDGYDVICDANGVATLSDSYKHLRRAGKLVVYGFHTMMPKSGGKPNWIKLAIGWLKTPRFNPLDLTSDSKSVLAFNLSFLFDRTDLLSLFIQDLQDWLAAGKIKAPPVTTYAMTDVAKAHADIESGNTVGKLVLIPEQKK